MNYQPKEFWDQRLSEQFDLRGTGETGLSLAYNQACYALRRHVLDAALAEAGVRPAGLKVLDVGCGTGFFSAYYLARGARLTGVDIAPTSIERLARRHPEAVFLLADISEASLEGAFDLINAFDVLYHIVDDARWERAVRTLAAAVAPRGTLLLTDTLADNSEIASHNRARSLTRYRALLEDEGLEITALYPTHVLLNRALGPLRFLNRLPWLLYGVDRALLAMGAGTNDPVVSKLLVARRTR